MPHQIAAPAPSTPLGPFQDSAITWTTWVTLMGFVGLVALTLLVTARRIPQVGPETATAATVRLARIAVPLGFLAIPAALTDLAHAAGGYDYGAAWQLVFDGTTPGLLCGLELTGSLAGAAILAPLMSRSIAGGRRRAGLLGAALACGATALGTTKFPSERPEDWSRTVFETAMWMLHLLGGSVWIGGLAGLLLLAAPGAVRAADRGAFWSPAIRRFTVAAMSCVAAIALSGLFLYWEHVDGPSQLLSTMYGRILGMKILIFGTLLLLGSVNQFWLHPKVEAMRAAGDDRPLRTILLKQFPAVLAAELLLGLTVLFVAPFLHGSARNQAHQSRVAAHSTTAAAEEAKLPPKQAGAGTWAWGTAETIIIVGLMVGGYRVSGRLAGRRNPASQPVLAPEA